MSQNWNFIQRVMNSLATNITVYVIEIILKKSIKARVTHILKDFSVLLLIENSLLFSKKFVAGLCPEAESPTKF